MKFEIDIDIGWFSGCHPCLENFAVDGFDKDKNNDILEEPTPVKVQVEEEAVEYEFEDNTTPVPKSKRKSRLLPWKGGRSKKAGKGDDASTGSNKSSSGSFLKSFKGRSTKGKSSSTEAIDAIAIVDVRDDESEVSRLDAIERSKDLASAPSRDVDMRSVMMWKCSSSNSHIPSSPMLDTKNGSIKEQTDNGNKSTFTSNHTKDHKDDGSRSGGGDSRSFKSSKMSWRRKASNNNKHKDSAHPQPILYDYYMIKGGVSDIMVRLPYNRSLTFAELRREIEDDFAEEMPLSEYNFLMNADGVAVGRSQEQKWLVRDYDIVDLMMGGDGTGLNPYLVYISKA